MLHLPTVGRNVRRPKHPWQNRPGPKCPGRNVRIETSDNHSAANPLTKTAEGKVRQVGYSRQFLSAH